MLALSIASAINNREYLDQNNSDKWDSGKVESDVSVNIAYAGDDLKSREAYWCISHLSSLCTLEITVTLGE